MHIRGKEGKEYMNIINVYNAKYSNEIGDFRGNNG